MAWLALDEYEKIRRVVPIVCVDLVVLDPIGNVLLIFRRDPPAESEWWLPGGRVLHGETRLEAVHRLLSREVGLVAMEVKECRTREVILPLPDGCSSHAVSTVFLAVVASCERLILESSIEKHCLGKLEQLSLLELRPYVRDSIVACLDLYLDTGYSTLSEKK